MCGCAWNFTCHRCRRREQIADIAHGAQPDDLLREEELLRAYGALPDSDRLVVGLREVAGR